MAKWAVFDIDGTLLPGLSIEARFILYSVRKNIIPYTKIIGHFLYGISGVFYGKGMDNFRTNKKYYKGLNVDYIAQTGNLFFKDRIAPFISKDGLKTIGEYRENGYKIMIMSGSIEFLIKDISQICEYDVLICTHIKTIDDVLTGEIEGLHPFGIHKKEILLHFQNEYDMDYEQSSVFANHHSDIYHMELFREAVAINPSKKLMKIANRLGWRIEFWE